MPSLPVDTDVCRRAVASRDRRFDGVFVTGVTSTGIYCRPSCPARTPKPEHQTFHPTAAAAQAAGFRACKRCSPDAVPGSPHWDLRADVAGRAMRLIADGVVERDGVPGLAGRLGYSPRHLSRLLTAELGAGPLALARAHRAQQARVLVESTSWPLAAVAFASGFSSVRQFNTTVREVYGVPPGAFRTARRRTGGTATQTGDGVATVEVRLAVRLPFDAAGLWLFLATHLTPGVETAGHSSADQRGGGAPAGRWYARALRLPHGAGTVRIHLADPAPGAAHHRVRCVLRLTDVRDAGAATERCRRLLDADADPVAVDRLLGEEPALAPAVRRRPGLRVPGHVDGAELALRTVLGQQVSVAAGNRLAGRLAALLGEPLPPSLVEPGLDRLPPDPAAVAAVDPALLPVPRARARALVALAASLADGTLRLDRSADRTDVRRAMLDVPGIGPWTAAYVAMRALGDPDAWLPTDLAVRRALAAVPAGDPSASWRPWRSYAVLHLWTDVIERAGTAAGAERRGDRRVDQLHDTVG